MKNSINYLITVGFEAYNSSNYNLAIKFYEKALYLASKNNEIELIVQCLDKIGLIYTAIGQFKKAHNSYQQLFLLKRKIGDKRGQGDALSNIGHIYESVKRYEDALKIYQHSLKLYNEIGIKSDIGLTLYKIGNVYRRRAEFDITLNYFKQALKIREELGDKIGISKTLRAIGNVYYSRIQYKASLKYFLRALQIKEEIKDKIGIGATVRNIGNAYLSLKKYEEALKYYHRGLQVYEELGDTQGISASSHNIGRVYKTLGNFEESIYYYQRELQIQEQTANKRGIGLSKFNIANLYFLWGRYNESLQNYLQSLQISEEIGDIGGRSICFSNMGFIHWKQHHFDDSFKYYLQSIDLVEGIIGRIKSEKIRKEYRAIKLDPYQGITGMLLDRHGFENDITHLKGALKFLELIKAREILDKLETKKVNVRTCPELNQLVEMEQKLINQKIKVEAIKQAEIRRGIHRSATDDEISEISKEWIKIRAELMEKCNDPGLIRVTKNYNPIPDFEELFKKEEVIVWEFVYLPNTKESFKIVTWDGTTISTFESNPVNRKNLLKLAQEFYNNLTKQNLDIALLKLKQLQQNLSAIIPNDLLATLKKKDKLILIPHDIFHLFPWEIVEEIGLRIPLVRSYSLGLVRSCMKREQQMSDTLLISNPNFNLAGRELPGADLEIESLIPLLQQIKMPYTVLKREVATESAFKEIIKQKFAIIHFAGHAVYNEYDPWMSGFYFYLPDKYDICTVTELVTNPFKGSPLLIMSACETGRSKFSKGDELVGLIRGLTLAGATSIIATNWSLADEVAPYFMGEFYKYFTSDKDVCKSLFEARKLIYEKFENPIYWGVFSLYGNPFKKLK